jgi:diguanylate cyclase (GGDEF)-like protein
MGDLQKLITLNLDILRQFFEPISDLIFLMAVEEGMRFRYLIVNPAAMRLACLNEDPIGKTIEEALNQEEADFLNRKYREAVLARQPIRYVVGNHQLMMESTLTPIFNADGVCTHVFCVTRDITHHKKIQDRLQYLAYHDMLTELPNRRLFEERCQAALDLVRDSGENLALLYIDCDLFKSINDRMGHDVGDEFLRRFANRLTHCVRESDTVARLAGDEFVILLPRIVGEEEAISIAERILVSLQKEWKIQEHRFHTTVSIGIALAPRDGESIEKLLRRADLALYQAKKKGRNTYQLYTPELEE